MSPQYKRSKRDVHVQMTGNSVQVYVFRGDDHKMRKYEAHWSATASHKARRALRGFRLMAAALKQVMEQQL